MSRKRRIGIVVGIMAGVVVLMLAGFVIYLHIYYGSRWYPGTMINGIDVSKQSLEESKKKLTDIYNDYELTIKARDNGSITIYGKDMDYVVDIGTEWEDLYKKQHESFVLSEKIRPNDIRNGRFDGEFSILFYNIKTKCHIFVLVFLL